MSKAVLIVEPNDARRAAIRQACAARGLQVLEVPEAMHGLAALGRADFGALIVAEGKRHLSLRGLVQLARKRHAGIGIFVILGNVANEAQVKGVLGDVTTVPPDWGVEQLATAIGGECSVHRVETLEQAVSLADELTRDGRRWNILLSPACASFDQFNSYAHRGEVFEALVAQLS